MAERTIHIQENKFIHQAKFKMISSANEVMSV